MHFRHSSGYPLCRFAPFTLSVAVNPRGLYQSNPLNLRAIKNPQIFRSEGSLFGGGGGSVLGALLAPTLRARPRYKMLPAFCEPTYGGHSLLTPQTKKATQLGDLVCLVEAGGVEPPSAGTPLAALHA